MTRLENHFSLNRILLLAIGLWPYEQSIFSRLQFILFSVILMSAIVFQLTVFLTARCTPDLILKVKELLNCLQDIRDELKDKNEIAITDEYGRNAKRCTAVLIMISMVGTCLFVVIHFWSDVLDVIFQINISRSHNLPIITEYFINQEKYYYLILMHLAIAVYIGIIVTLAVGTMLIAFYHNTCGVFRIASYRIKHSINSNMIQNSIKNEALMSERIICAVGIHRQAMKLTRSMVSKLQVMYCCLIPFGVATLSLNLFRLCLITSLKIDLMEMMPPIVSIFVIIVFMFIGNYLGQDLTDHCKDVFLNAYNIQWYMAPLPVQSLILFLLQRGATDFKVNIGGLYYPSLESFAMLVKISMSYFTVIYSTR
ncbi:odorant receptor 9a isoform X2 [Ooceraea biroi]|uniref:odorant receptor 9a isoform X2 n=1 Tax=Ooceraea biroi TaxID=2015173 RepID=UPI000F083F3B|nr:odorant receptor 9a isoform X2 [Ooceraea biroi]